MATVPASVDGFAQHTIGVYSPQSIGVMMACMDQQMLSSAAWPTANLAFFFPFTIDVPTTVVKLSWENGATVSGNVDVGIYNSEGNRIVSAGSTAQSGTSALQTVDIADTLLLPGKWYYFALVLDNTTGTVISQNPAAGVCQAMGILSMASAFALPATATFASVTGTIRVSRVTAHTQTLV